MNRQEIIYYLKGVDDNELFSKSKELRRAKFGTNTYLRGLIELSNICSCDCLYCGIRASNREVTRYSLTYNDVERAAKFALDNNWGGVVIQSGELRTSEFAGRIERLVRMVKQISDNKLAITLSCGEQSREVYKRWQEAGADRYLLRIESSNETIFNKIHPPAISFSRRCRAVSDLVELGYRTGSGVMIGLPHQRVEDMADDLLWLKSSGVQMVGMGPYIEHRQTPLFSTANSEYSPQERLEYSLRMIALARILLPNANIAASTALSTLNIKARYKALEIGANVLMPNVTPQLARSNYSLYEGKSSDLDLEGIEIVYDSLI